MKPTKVTPLQNNRNHNNVCRWHEKHPQPWTVLMAVVLRLDLQTSQKDARQKQSLPLQRNPAFGQQPEHRPVCKRW
jgi:hypothetical protein